MLVKVAKKRASNGRIGNFLSSQSTISKMTTPTNKCNLRSGPVELQQVRTPSTRSCSRSLLRAVVPITSVDYQLHRPSNCPLPWPSIFCPFPWPTFSLGKLKIFCSVTSCGWYLQFGWVRFVLLYPWTWLPGKENEEWLSQAVSTQEFWLARPQNKSFIWTERHLSQVDCMCG